MTESENKCGLFVPKRERNSMIHLAV